MPGIGEAVGNELQTRAQTQQANAALPGTQSMIANDPQMQGFQDPNHPAWDVLNNMTAGAGQGALPIATPGVAQVQPGGGQTTGYQNGGVVRQNFGKAAIQPAFERGPALPVGPNNTIMGTPSPRMGMLGMENGGPVPGYAPTRESQGLGQGITPARTEGQVLTMDAGGVVPQGFSPQPGITGVPMNGSAAGFLQGMQAGQNLGNNLYEAFAKGKQNNTFDAVADQMRKANINNADQSGASAPDAQQPGVLDQAKSAVEDVFHHIFSKTLNHDHQPNDSVGIQPAPGVTPPAGAAPPAAASGTAPGAVSPGVAAVPGAPAPGNAGAPGAPGQPPPGIAAPSPIPTPAGATPPGQSGAGTDGSAQPQSSQPQPVAGQPTQNQVMETAAAKTIAASDPNVAAGKPSTDPAANTPHSLTPEYWSKLEDLKWQAVKAAQRAGEDPAKVYESLTAMQNAHFQGQLLKQASTAYQAFQNNDIPALKQAIKNMNYYLPNGQDIDIKTATAQDAAADPTGNTKVGDVMHANPFYGMVGHQGETPYVKVDQNYLSSLGTNLLDPRNAAHAQMESYSAQMEAGSNRIKAQAEADTAAGRKFTGLAAVQNAGTKAAQLDVDRRLKIAAGNKDQAEANWYNVRQPGGSTGQHPVTLAQIDTMQKQVSDGVDKLSQGLPGFIDPYETDASGNRALSLSPVAGKTVPDPTRIPHFLTNGTDKTGKSIPLTPDQQQNIKVIGGQIIAANAGLSGMDVNKAIELGARITHQESHPTTHVDPKTGKPMHDFVYDGKKGLAHIWVGNGYENVYLSPNVADGGGQGGSQETPPPGGNSAGLASGEGGSPGPDAFQ